MPVRLQESPIDPSISQPNSSVVSDIPKLYNLADNQLLIVILFTLAPIALFLHSTFIYIIFFSNKRKKYKNAFYILVVCISCADIYWCFYQMYQGFCNLMGHCPIGELGNVLISSDAQFFFYLCMNLDLLIAVNRFSAIVLCTQHEKIFNRKKAIFYVLVFMIGSAIECIPTWIYKKKYYVEIQTFTFLNMPPEYIVKLITWTELGITYVCHAIMAVCYIWSFIIYRRLKKSTVTMTAAQINEGRLLIQAVFSGIPCFTVMTFHHLIRLPLVETLGVDWCILNGPIVYLWFNSELRTDWLEFIGLKAVSKKIYINTFMKNKFERKTNVVNAIDNFTARVQQEEKI